MFSCEIYPDMCQLTIQYIVLDFLFLLYLFIWGFLIQINMMQRVSQHGWVGFVFN